MTVTRVREEKANSTFKWIALGVLVGGLLYCLFLAGVAKFSRAVPFQPDTANFALFAGFIVVAGAIERFMEPIAALLPDSGNDAQKKSDRALLTGSFSLVIGIAISSIFGLYFMEAVGVNLGEDPSNFGDRMLRGADVFVTALIITGGTKQLHDLIKSIEKAKENAGR
jgi:hypothetical protein